MHNGAEDQVQRWTPVLADVAERLREERGLTDPWQVVVDHGDLWAEYGELRLRMADLPDADGLFDQVDGWAAFHRSGGPGRVLERDRRAMAQWREELPALRLFWEPVVRRIAADVEATTDLGFAWTLGLQETELALPPVPGLTLTFGDAPLPVREVPFPQLVLRLPHQSWELPALDDVDEAVLYLADRVQEYVIEELHGAWPRCPGHQHPRGLAVDGRPVWRCPDGSGAVQAVGRLGAG